MKKTRLFKVLTSAVLTGAMVMTMGGMTAFANTTEIDLTKTVTTDGNTYAPVTTFNFEIANGDAGTKGTDVVYEGKDGGLTLLDTNDFTFGPTVTDMDTVKASYDVTGKIKADSSVFTEPGIYHYVLKETIPDNKYEGIKYDETQYDIYVYVERGNDDTFSVAAVVAVVDGADTTLVGSDGKSNGLTFTNDYGKDDDNDSTHDVVITKEVTGNQGDKNKEFTFEVSVSGIDGEKYKVVKTAQDGTTTESALDSKADAVTYTLKHGESIRIYGLTESDTYTVIEQDYSSDGYTTTYTGNNTGTLTADDTQVTVTNNKNVTTPTGIVLSFAPYILMVALAGVFAVLFLRRRKEEF